ncbi:glycosyltransferase [Arenimonas alkanexedens]
MPPSLAIVIPLGPGELDWRQLLPSVLSSTAAELTVVHTTGADPSELPAAGGRVHLVESRQGRAAQMNAGAAATLAPWLWFLHADSRMASDTLARLAQYLDGSPDGIGYFDLRFLPDGPGLVRLNEWGARFRSRQLQLPFGDQGFVMHRDTFQALGGFDESLASAEDHALVWRARRMGIPLRPVGAELWTSARKYRRKGWLGTTLSHLGTTLMQARRFASSEAAR